MHRLTLVALFAIASAVILLVASPAATAPQAVKIAYVDFDRVLTISDAGKQASAQFEQTRKQKQLRIDAEQDRLRKAAAQLEKERPSLDRPSYEARRAKLQGEFTALQETFSALEKELADGRANLIKAILKKAEPVIVKLAAEQGYSMILDRTAVVWGRSSLDLTPQIIARLK